MSRKTLCSWEEYFDPEERDLIRNKHMLFYTDMRKWYSSKDEVIADIKCNYGYWLAVDVTGSDKTQRFDTVYKYIFNSKWSEIKRIAQMELHSIYPYIRGYDGKKEI